MKEEDVMERMFERFTLNNLAFANRFVLPPIKLGYGNADGTVSERQLSFYREVAQDGPAMLILEPVSVTGDGKEHPKQLCVHLEGSEREIKKIVDVIHDQGRLACLHLNHAGAAAETKLIGGPARGPSAISCMAKEGSVSIPLTEEEIQVILGSYRAAAEKAQSAGVDVIEIQGGHGYLVSQFLNAKLNKRKDRFGRDRLLFAKEAISSVKAGAPHLPCILRISGSEMSPESGISQEDLLPLLKLSEDEGISAIHVGMGNACFNPAWYFHHGSLPEKPQTDALAWVRSQTTLPLIVAGRMGRKERITRILDDGLADLVALGRPLIVDPHLVDKWRKGMEKKIIYCGYCLQGCLHRLREGEPLGCNFNPEIGLESFEPAKEPMRVLIAGGGPAGMSAALYMSRRGHQVTLAEKEDHLGGQFALAWKTPGKEAMREALESLIRAVEDSGASIILNRVMDPDLIRKTQPDLLVWATGALQNIPEIPGLEDQYAMTALEFLGEKKDVHGPRVLVIGAGRSGLEIAEKLGQEGYEVVATKRTDPIGSRMEAITRSLTLMRIGQMPKVTLMKHTAVKAFLPLMVDIEQDGMGMSLEPFQTVILASGMLSSPEPDEGIRNNVPTVETIGDASDVGDIFAAVRAGYRLAQTY